MSAGSKSEGSLWSLAFAPTIWALHFLWCYVTAAIVCAKRAGEDAAWMDIRISTAIYTLIALGAISGHAWRCLKRSLKKSSGTENVGRPAAAGGHGPPYANGSIRFLGVTGILLAILSAVAIAFVSLPAFLFGGCQ